MRSVSQPTPTEMPSDRDAAFRLLFADHPLPMWIYDLASLQFLEVNAAAITRYGYTHAEFLQLRVQDLNPPRAATDLRATAPLDQAGYAQHRTRDGHIIAVETISRPMVFDGRAARLVCVIDISERLTAQAAQRASEARLASVIASAMDAVISIDAEQRIILFNRAAETMFRCRADQAIGQPIDRFIPDRFRAVHRDHILRFGATGITSRSMGQLNPISGVRADGEQFPIEASISQVDSGDHKIYTVILRDITTRKQAEEALRESHARLQKVLEVETVGVMFWDLTTGHMTDANDAFLNLMGYSRREVEARELTWQNLTPPEYMEVSLAEIRKFQATGRVGPYEKEYIRKDGTRQWLVFAGSSLGGNTCVEFCVDISDRKRAEEALRESEARFGTIFENSPTAIGISRLSDQKITHVNAAFCELYGFSRAETINHTTQELNIWAYPVERQRFIDLLREHKHVRGVEATARLKSGVHRSVLISGEVLEIDHEPCLLAQIIDITDRKQAESALRESEAWFRATFEQAAIGIESLSLDGHYLRGNAALSQMLGYSEAELRQRRFSDITQPDDLRREESLLADLLAGRISSYTIEKRYIRRDDQPVWVRVTSSLAEGPTPYRISIIEDISERKQAEAQIRQLNEDLERRVVERTVQLEASNRELEAFSYSVSHDLRAPLRAIDGFARILTRKAQGVLPTELQRYLDLIRDNAQRMGTLIDDLLTFSRLGRLPLTKQRVNMNQLVRNALLELQAEQAGRRVEIKIGELSDCQGDPALLKQVWLNLLSNALKYTRRSDPATIEIDATTTDTEVLYSVKDNGVGFDMQYADKLFGVFQRFHRQEDYEGTGVGLAIVHRIITQHGGRIWAQAALGSGATFTFVLERTTE
ncbi:MAG: PAS domain S-box protein [Anaerolineae bacterium]